MKGLTRDALLSIYMFIAELRGYKKGTKLGKIKYGIKCYRNLDLGSYEDVEEYIWLERIYEELSKYYMAKAFGAENQFKWTVPIELDASASMLGYIGCLLGERRLLEMTNLAGDRNKLNDPWSVDGLTREQAKKVATPKLYGSAQSAVTLWKKNKVDYSLEDVQVINRELQVGALGVANQFKEFIISYVKPETEMDVVIGNDKFAITCNHWKKVGEVTQAYDLYDTDTKRIRRIHHTKTKAVPDLDRYKRYFVTLLVHNLDGQVMDRVAEKVMDKYGFCIDIHDAVLIHPNAAKDTRTWYAEEMQSIYDNRQTILNDFFKSVGIGGEAMEAWTKLMSLVDPVENFVARGEVLK